MGARQREGQHAPQLRTNLTMSKPAIDIVSLGLLSDGVNEWRTAYVVRGSADDTYLLEIMRLILAGDTQRLHQIGERALREKRFEGHPSDTSI